MVAKYGEIGEWDLSQVTSMDYMFAHMENFNENISAWDVSNVKDMSGMFYGRFHGPKPSWYHP